MRFGPWNGWWFNGPQDSSSAIRGRAARDCDLVGTKSSHEVCLPCKLLPQYESPPRPLVF